MNSNQPGFKPTESSVTLIEYDSSAPHVALPVGDALLDAEFNRRGHDLIITVQKQQFLLEDYFTHDAFPALLSETGKKIVGSSVNLLAGPDSPGEYAGVPDPSDAEPIGTIDKLEGDVTIIRNGQPQEAEQGDPVFMDDVIQTDGDSGIGIAFNDGSVFTLGEDARMTLDEFVYDPETGDGSSSVNVVKGMFRFISGEIAANNPGEMKVETPVATIGIRGTTGGGQVNGEGKSNQFFLEPNADGTVGTFTVVTKKGEVVLDQPNTVTTVGSFTTAPGKPAQLQKGDLGNELDFLQQITPQAIYNDRAAQQEPATNEAQFVTDAASGEQIIAETSDTALEVKSGDEQLDGKSEPEILAPSDIIEVTASSKQGQETGFTPPNDPEFITLSPDQQLVQNGLISSPVNLQPTVNKSNEDFTTSLPSLMTDPVTTSDTLITQPSAALIQTSLTATAPTAGTGTTPTTVGAPTPVSSVTAPPITSVVTAPTPVAPVPTTLTALDLTLLATAEGITGTSLNDTFRISDPSNLVGDTINGAAGIDRLVIADTGGANTYSLTGGLSSIERVETSTDDTIIFSKQFGTNSGLSSVAVTNNDTTVHAKVDATQLDFSQRVGLSGDFALMGTGINKISNQPGATTEIILNSGNAAIRMTGGNHNFADAAGSAVNWQQLGGTLTGNFLGNDHLALKNLTGGNVTLSGGSAKIDGTTALTFNLTGSASRINTTGTNNTLTVNDTSTSVDAIRFSGSMTNLVYNNTSGSNVNLHFDNFSGNGVDYVDLGSNTASEVRFTGLTGSSYIKISGGSGANIRFDHAPLTTVGFAVVDRDLDSVNDSLKLNIGGQFVQLNDVLLSGSYTVYFANHSPFSLLQANRQTSVTFDTMLLSGATTTALGTSTTPAAIVGMGSLRNDFLVTSSASTSVNGGLGDDVVRAAHNNTTVLGGQGNDTLIKQTGTHSVQFSGSDGFDLLDYKNHTAALTVDLTASITDGIFADTILGGIEGIITGSGQDIIGGGTGNDWIDGGAGDDYIDGNGGVDTVVYENHTAGVTVDLAAGTGGATGEFDTLTGGITHAVGSAHSDVLQGNNLDNILMGLAGADSIAGGTGADTLIGGLGNDTLDAGSDTDEDIIVLDGATVSFDTILNFNTGQDKIDIHPRLTAGDGRNYFDLVEKGYLAINISGADSIISYKGTNIAKVDGVTNLSWKDFLIIGDNDILDVSGTGIYNGFAGDDVFVRSTAATATFNGGDGWDTLRLSGASFDSATAGSVNSIEQIELNGQAAAISAADLAGYNSEGRLLITGNGSESITLTSGGGWQSWAQYSPTDLPHAEAGYSTYATTDASGNLLVVQVESGVSVAPS